MSTYDGKPRSRSRVLAPNEYKIVSRSDWRGWKYDSNTKVFSDYDSMEDIVTPGYAKRIARGEIINNECFYERHTYQHTGGCYLKVDYNSSQYDLWSGPGQKQIVTLSEMSEDYAALLEPTVSQRSKTEANCKVRALSNIDKTPYAFGEDLLELRETIRFIKRPLGSIADALTAHARVAKRRSLRNRISYAKALAGVWNTGRFALAPLIRSIYDVAEAWDDRGATMPERLTARGFDKQQSSGSSSEDIELSTVTYDCDMSSDLKFDGHASILYKIHNPIYDMKFRLGLRMKDHPLTLWQVVPLSFMVDRVANVSTAVAALTNILDPSVEILAASYREKNTYERKFSVDSGTHVSYGITANLGEVVHSDFYYRRYPWKPSVSDVSIPTHLKGLVDDVTKIIDLATIITSLVGLPEWTPPRRKRYYK